MAVDPTPVLAERIQRMAALQDAAEAQRHRWQRWKLAGKVLVTMILFPIAIPWWAIRCWLDLSAEDRTRAERARRRLKFSSIPGPSGRANVAVRSAQRTTTNSNWPFV